MQQTEQTESSSKEPLAASDRFKIAMAAVVVEIALLISPAFVDSLDPIVVSSVSLAIAGVVATFIYGRTIRNTESTDTVVELETIDPIDGNVHGTQSGGFVVG